MDKILKELNTIFGHFLNGDEIKLDSNGNFTNKDSDINVLITKNGFSIYEDGHDDYNTELDLTENDLKVILKAIKYLKEEK